MKTHSFFSANINVQSTFFDEPKDQTKASLLASATAVPIATLLEIRGVFESRDRALSCGKNEAAGEPVAAMEPASVQVAPEVSDR